MDDSIKDQLSKRNSITMEGIGSQITPTSLVEFDSFDLHSQNHTFDGYSTFSTLQATIINDLHAGTRPAIVNSGASVTSLGRNAGRDDDFEEQFVSGIPFSCLAGTNLVASRNDLQENVTNLAISEPSIYPFEALRTYASNDFANALSASLSSSANYGSDEMFGDMPAPLRTAFQPYLTIGSMEPSSWISSNNVNLTACSFNNELSLSLASSQPSATNGTTVSDQCSEISCSGVTPSCMKESRLGSEQTCSSSKELSLLCSSYSNGQISQVILGSRYLQVIQEILAQIASYSLENLDQMNFTTGCINIGTNVPFSSMLTMERGMQSIQTDELPEVDNKYPALQKGALEAKKTQLLALLQVVDDRYNQCLDEIHTVISAFHAATELDPQIHTRFALQTISLLYKSLRERISSQILAMGNQFGSNVAGKSEESLGSCYLRKQWTLGQLKKKDHQLWKPQRGLPERSVSVLRAWMFQNFLHPYPRDAEKHLLAVKSGLTRSQVSNWFINARVRLWKPMIEEMYAESSKRKSGRNEEGSSNSNQRNRIGISNLRFNVN